MKLNTQQKVELEKLIDATSLYDVVWTLEELTSEKGQHLISNWQDRAAASPWFRASNLISRLRDRLESLSI